MIRYRRRIVFSWPLVLWMLNALLVQFADWISLSDLRALAVLSLSSIALNFGLVLIQYFVCALVSPEFETDEDYDLRKFHAREGPTYITAFLVVMFHSLLMNATAGVGDEIDQNWLVFAMLVPIVAALLVRKHWVQVLAPAALLALQVAYPIIYYPVLR